MTVSHPDETAHLLGLSLCTCAGIAILLPRSEIWYQTNPFPSKTSEGPYAAQEWSRKVKRQHNWGWQLEEQREGREYKNRGPERSKKIRQRRVGQSSFINLTLTLIRI